MFKALVKRLNLRRFGTINI